MENDSNINEEDYRVVSHAWLKTFTTIINTV